MVESITNILYFRLNIICGIFVNSLFQDFDEIVVHFLDMASQFKSKFCFKAFQRARILRADNSGKLCVFSHIHMRQLRHIKRLLLVGLYVVYD